MRQRSRFLHVSCNPTTYVKPEGAEPLFCKRDEFHWRVIADTRLFVKDRWKSQAVAVMESYDRSVSGYRRTSEYRGDKDGVDMSKSGHAARIPEEHRLPRDQSSEGQVDVVQSDSHLSRASTLTATPTSENTNSQQH